MTIRFTDALQLAAVLDPTTTVESTGFQTTPPRVVKRAILDNQTGATILVPDVVIEEQGNDSMIITDHPVEKGTAAFISDHAYKLPAELVIGYGWSPSGPGNSNGSPNYIHDVYNQVLALQSSARLVQVYTGKRAYTSMLIQSVTLSTDRFTDNALLLRISLREVLLATTTQVEVSLDPTTQLNPDKTLGPTARGVMQLQPAPNFNYDSYNQNFLGDLSNAQPGAQR
jgi:hypothetical protein